MPIAVQQIYFELGELRLVVNHHIFMILCVVCRLWPFNWPSMPAVPPSSMLSWAMA